MKEFNQLYMVGYDDNILNHSQARIQYLVFETNALRKKLLFIDYMLNTYKRMTYEQWSALHFIEDELRENIRLNEEKIQEIVREMK